MDLFSQLSDADANMIKAWIASTASMDDERICITRNDINLPQVLRKWNCEKETLFQLLGNQFIIEKDVVYEMPQAHLQEEIRHIFQDTNGVPSIFRELVLKNVEKYSEDWYILKELFSSSELAGNSCSYSNRLHFRNKNIKIQRGTKPMRILHKLAKMIDEEELFEQFRLIHSRLLNRKKLTGTLCLSIHPMDYMTMSDNSYDWDSCMSWLNKGCYRAGTIEMMNSPFIVVAYLRGSNPFYYKGQCWSGNKKWRQLYVVHPKGICNIKEYPYNCQGLSDLALNWLAELARTNLHWNIPFDAVYFNMDNNFGYHDLRIYTFRMKFDYMYNDFDTDNTCHKIYIPQGWQNQYNKDDIIDVVLYLSGSLTCACCGSYFECDDGVEVKLLCSDCEPELICDCCENSIPGSDYDTVEGMLMCGNCLDEYTYYDNLLNQRCLEENTFKLFLTRINDHLDPRNDLVTNLHQVWLTAPTLTTSGNNCLKDNVTIKQGRLPDDDTIYYYVNFDDCTDYGLRALFDFWQADRASMLKCHLEDPWWGPRSVPTPLIPI